MGDQGYRIVYNDDGYSLSGVSTLEEFLEKTVDRFIGTQVDALFWCVGSSDVYTFNTRVGELFGSNVKKFDNVHTFREYQSMKRLLEGPRDYIQALAERTHKTGIKFFASIRMNDCHDSPRGWDVKDQYSRFRREHPEMLLGDAVHPSFETAFDFSFPEVRQRRYAVIEEIVQRYDIDGVEMDFLRHYYYFKPEEAYKNRYLITNLLRRVRKCLDKAGEEMEKPLSLAVRVPTTFEIASSIGLDTEAWIQQGLVDIVIAATPRGVELNLPLEDYVEALKGKNCVLLAQIGWYHPPEKARAAALNFWKAGADGIYLFNWYARRDLRRDSLLEIGDPNLILHRDKCYVVDKQEGEMWAPAHPKWQIPIMLRETTSGKGASIRFDIGDEVESAEAEGILESSKLSLEFDEIHEEDDIQVKLNGSPNIKEIKLWGEDKSWPFPMRHASLEYPLSVPPLRSGENRLEVILNRRNPLLACPLTLKQMEIHINYKKG